MGVAQARLLAERLALLSIDRLVSSPMRRCVETARIVAERTRHRVEILPGSHEHRKEPGYLSWGARELRARYPDLLLPEGFTDEDWPYGDEPIEDAIARADEFIAWMVELSRATESRRIAVVTHAAITRIILYRALGLNAHAAHPNLIFDNTSLTTLRVAEGGIKALSVNDTTHLAGIPELDPLQGINR
jgi:probable phosphoglycerate mutase